MDAAASGAAGSPLPDDDWRQELVLALRVRDVPGRRIGDVLAEVEAHCADSGQGPREAFGDPEDYAGELAPGGRPTLVRPWLLKAAATALGVLALLSGVDATVHGGRPSVTVGVVLSLLVTLALAAVVVLRLNDLVRSGWRAWLGLSVGFVALTTLPALLPQRLLSLPARPVLLAGVLLLAAAWWRPGGAAGVADEVVDPRTGAPLRPVPPWVGRALAWFFPLTLLVAVVLVALVPA